jgi:hypothetical protein
MRVIGRTIKTVGGEGIAGPDLPNIFNSGFTTRLPLAGARAGAAGSSA